MSWKEVWGGGTRADLKSLKRSHPNNYSRKSTKILGDITLRGPKTSRLDIT